MPLNFPSSPSNGQVFIDGSKIYVWDATNSVWNSGASGNSVLVNFFAQSNQPVETTPFLWWDTSNPSQPTLWIEDGT